MIWDKTRARLLAGEAILGWFEIAGTDEALPGSLRWDASTGAMVELVDPSWQKPVNTEHLTLHGRLEESDYITLLDGIVRTTTWDDRVKRVGSYTLVLGEHITGDMTWQRAVFATANLGEWRAETGLGHSDSQGEGGSHLAITWDRPPKDEVPVNGARLTFGPVVDWEIGRIPRHTITTRQQTLVAAGRPMRIEALFRRYAMPLVALTAFAADRPDSIVEEHYIDRRREQRVEVWRAGAAMEQPEWRPDALLVYAGELPDFRLAVVRWWRLYERVRPALGIFGDYINEGNTFSRPRLITLHTAICGYTDARHGHRDPRKLRTFAQVPNEVIGCSNDALGLFGAARDYFAHLGSPGQRYSVEEIEEGTPLATRRAAALMQAALLRELGFSKTKATHVLERHYRNWPL